MRRALPAVKLSCCGAPETVVDDVSRRLKILPRFGCRRTVVTHRITGRGSADWLGQVHDEPLGSAHRGHAPAVLVLTDAADQVVAVRGEPVEDRPEVVQLEGHV